MVDVIFELTTNDPWSVDDAICEVVSPFGYWQKVNRSPTQTTSKPYKTYSGVHTNYVHQQGHKHIHIHPQIYIFTEFHSCQILNL